MENTAKNTEIKYWIAFSRINGIGPINFSKILDYFKSLKDAWAGNYADFISAGIKEALAKDIITFKNSANPDNELEICQKENVAVLLIIDQNYPEILKEIFGAPPILFCRGNIDCLNSYCFAMVGARKNTFYGEEAIRKIMPDLINNSFTIVSGLALGIDSIAHQICLENGGTTIGVLGGGVDKSSVYPTYNRLLAEKIIDQGGCLISEYAPHTLPTKQSFPLRNRIISGLSHGALIVEAGESSGALITAKYALEQNREVFAVPGSIFNSKSQGTNNLIKQGAKLVSCADDILDELNIQKISVQTSLKINQELTSEEQLILKTIPDQTIHVDKLSQICRIKISVLSSLLMTMELKGLIKDTGGKNYIKL